MLDGNSFASIAFICNNKLRAWVRLVRFPKPLYKVTVKSVEDPDYGTLRHMKNKGSSFFEKGPQFGQNSGPQESEPYAEGSGYYLTIVVTWNPLFSPITP